MNGMTKMNLIKRLKNLFKIEPYRLGESSNIVMPDNTGGIWGSYLPKYTDYVDIEDTDTAIRQERDELKALLVEYLTLEGGQEINDWHDRVVRLLK
jgi:hypothetical protein